MKHIDKSVVMVASYGGPYGGNFIPSLIAYNQVIKSLGFRTVYVFPEFVKEYAWVDSIREKADSVYFIPYRPYSIKNLILIRKICKKEHAALVYSRMSGWEITARFAVPRIPMIWHFEMGLDLSEKRTWLKYWIKFRLLGFGNTHHIAVSESAADTINSLNPRFKCEWIPNAINLGRLIPKEKKDFASPAHLLTFAYQPIIKGFDIALDALEKLNQNETKFILMASAQKQTYQYVEKRYGDTVPRWLVLLEPTDKISDLFDNADILLSPSRSEGLSFANLEGLFSGLPIVYSDIPGNKILEEFDMTYVFETENSESLVDGIYRCLENKISPESRKKNRRIIDSEYSMEAWAGRIKKSIEELLH